MAKKESLLQDNGRGYVGGIMLTPEQAKQLAATLKVSIPFFEGTLPSKPSVTQITYLAALNKRLEDAEVIAGL